MATFEYSEYGDYTVDNETDETFPSVAFSNSSTNSLITQTLVTINTMISLLGLVGNALVIWISGFKLKRTVNTTWYLSLAISDFLFCACLPFNVFYMAAAHWPFGRLLCKFSSSALFLNMFSSVFLLVLISADRCALVTWPVWSQNSRTVGKASGLVVLAWLLSAALTTPSLVHRQTKTHGSATLCYTEYGQSHRAVALIRFVCGFAVPVLMIIFCCSVLFAKLMRLTAKSSKPFKVLAALVLSFAVCWVPFHASVLAELHLDQHSLEAVGTGLNLGTTLAAANSCVNPVLYVFIGQDFRRVLRTSVLWRMENAMAEDGRTDRPHTSKSFDNKSVTQI